MEMWTEVRRRVLTGELSKRAACQEYGINWRPVFGLIPALLPPLGRQPHFADCPARHCHSDCRRQFTSRV